MARKTNKTDHVLNLLAGGGNDKEETKKRRKAAPPVDPSMNVSVLQSANGEGDPIANAIKNQLEEDLQKELEQEKANLPDLAEMKNSLEEERKNLPDLEEVKNSLREEPVQAEENLPDLKDMKDSRMEETTVETTPTEPQVQEEVKAEEPTEVEEEKETTIETTPTEPQVQEEVKVEEPVVEESEFIILNIMEGLVKRKLPELMERFGNCMCERCLADATAYALTHLPAKYVVMNRKDATAPMISFYESKYAGQTMVECTKACIVVKEKPFHEQ